MLLKQLEKEVSPAKQNDFQIVLKKQNELSFFIGRGCDPQRRGCDNERLPTVLQALMKGTKGFNAHQYKIGIQ